jgi:hypothetical protein
MFGTESSEAEFVVHGRYSNSGDVFPPFIVRAANWLDAHRVASRPGLVIEGLAWFDPKVHNPRPQSYPPDPLFDVRITAEAESSERSQQSVVELPEIKFSVHGRNTSTGDKFSPFIVRASNWDDAYRAASRPGLVIDSLTRYEPPKIDHSQSKAVQLAKYEPSGLVAFFNPLAVISIILGCLGLTVAITTGDPQERMIGFVLSSGLGSGFFLLGLGKVIDCLDEMVFRLRRLEGITAKLQINQAKSGESAS